MTTKKQRCSVCLKSGHNKRTCPSLKFWKDMCHANNTLNAKLLDAFTHAVPNPNLWKENPDGQFPILIHNKSDQVFNIYWLIDPVPNNSQSDHRLFTGGPKNWRCKHLNIKPGWKIIIPVGCIGHVFGFFQKCDDNADINSSRIIRIRDWNIGKKITFDGKQIYVHYKGKTITNLPLLVRYSYPEEFHCIKYL